MCRSETLSFIRALTRSDFVPKVLLGIETRSAASRLRVTLLQPQTDVALEVRSPAGGMPKTRQCPNRRLGVGRDEFC